MYFAWPNNIFFQLLYITILYFSSSAKSSDRVMPWVSLTVICKSESCKATRLRDVAVVTVFSRFSCKASVERMEMFTVSRDDFRFKISEFNELTIAIAVLCLICLDQFAKIVLRLDSIAALRFEKI